MSIIYRVQQKFINNYVSVTKSNELWKHKHNTEETCLAGIYLFKVYNKNTRKRCEICSKAIITKKKTELQVKKNGNHFVRSIYYIHFS